MQRIKNFVHRLTQEGAQVIVITENLEDFNSMDKVSVVGEWNDSWQLVDKTVGENRRMLWLDVIQDDIFELDALETYVPAGIMDEGMFWFNSTGAVWPKLERQKTISQLKHLVIILGGKDFYTTLDSLKNKLPEHIHQDYIISPLSEKKDSDGKFYYKPQALTVILEWPKMIDREGSLMLRKPQ